MKPLHVESKKPGNAIKPSGSLWKYTISHFFVTLLNEVLNRGFDSMFARLT